MPAFYEYALKASLCLAIIFLFYTVLLKQLTCYNANRYFLLTFSALSFIVPLINLNVFVPAHDLNNYSIISRVPIIGANEIPLNFAGDNKAINYPQILFAVYVFICLILSFRLLVQIFLIRRIRSKAVRTLAGGVEIYNLSEPVLPFSFLSNIFINKSNYNEDDLTKIIHHERVHVQQKHTIDVLFSEIICIFNWHNPFAWLMKKAIRENLEYIADSAVLEQGVDKKTYQYLLLKVTGDVSTSIASNLKFTSLKSRIRMMNKTKTSRLHLLKFALLVPLVTILLLAFRNKHEIYKATFKEQNTKTTKHILSSLTYSVPDKQVETVVKNDRENCLLRTGEALDLDMVFNEKARLKSLLEENGYHKISEHAITFMIDTASGNNSFSIQVNINLVKDELSKISEERGRTVQIGTPENKTEHSMKFANQNIQSTSKEILGKNEFTNKQLLLDDDQFSSVQ